MLTYAGRPAEQVLMLLAAALAGFVYVKTKNSQDTMKSNENTQPQFRGGGVHALAGGGAPRRPQPRPLAAFAQGDGDGGARLGADEHSGSYCPQGARKSGLFHFDDDALQT
jgi:hypothetical protein